MATISSTTSEKVIGIKKFLGLNEAEDGDNQLKPGEAAVCRNFKITDNGNLKKRPGTAELFDLRDDSTTAPVNGMWHGHCSGKEVFFSACDGKLYSLWDDTTDTFYVTPVVVGSLNTSNEITFIPFEGIVYILNGDKYYRVEYSSGSWVMTDYSDGNHGYRPLIAITVPPAGGGELLEEVNKLNGMRRCWLSPDGENATFVLPRGSSNETWTSLDYVTDLGTGTIIPSTNYTYSLTNKTITFNTAPVLGVDSIEVAWTVAENFAPQVKAMRYAELYMGTQDTRIMIYGNGTNEAFYSGVDYNKKPRGDYFPDLYEIAVGDANTPITAMIRHYSTLIAFKTDSAYAIQYGITTLETGEMTPTFYSSPTNRILGNEALGQVMLVLNAPITLCANNLYEWRNNSSYSSNLSTDERQAKNISEKIHDSLKTFNFSECRCYDDNANSEYWVVYNGDALIHNYIADAWYSYTGLNISKLLEFNGDMYIGTTDGRILLMSEEYTADSRADSVNAIDCYWESGAMDYGSSYMRKYSALMWVAVKPELDNEIIVTVETDRVKENTVLVVEPQMTTELPQVKRCKIKVKKFVYSKLIFRSNNIFSRATIVDAEIRVRYTSYAKG